MLNFIGRESLKHYGLSDIQLDIVYACLSHNKNLPRASRDLLTNIGEQHQIVFYMDKRCSKLRSALVKNEYEIRLKLLKNK